MDRLGVQTSRVALLDGDQRSRQDESATAVLEWTINGVPLGEIVGDPTSTTPLYAAADEDQRRELLLRLRGDRSDLPTFVPRFERSPCSSAEPTGRVGGSDCSNDGSSRLVSRH